MKWGQSVCIRHTRDDIYVIFAVGFCQLPLITRDQPSLNFQNTLAHRENEKNYFQGSSFEQATILRILLKNLEDSGSTYA
jgi:hypothetical protein